jgi:RNA recognition motif-containing protein
MQTLYLKNLAADVAEPDLVGIFGRFETSREPKLIYRLMQRGRMKGQAFITFAGIYALPTC